jgi:alpha-glucoside transport system substrate-binding protein
MSISHRVARAVARAASPARQVAALVLAVTVVAACAGAQAAPSGGTVRVLGSWEGAELASFRAMVEPFEQRTGIRVIYSGTRDLEGVIERRLVAGNPPDLAGLAGPAHLAALSRRGVLKDLRTVLDVGTYKRETAPALVDLGTVDGRLAGVFIKSTVKGLLWFNPDVYRHGTPSSWAELQQLALRPLPEGRPWCVGLESGASSGWPGSDWIEDFLLRQSGAAVYDRWVSGQHPWSSPEIRRAFESYGQIVAEGNVFGGVQGATTTYFAMAGRPLFSDSPGCVFLHGGSFMSALLADEPANPAPRFDFLPFPDIDPKHAGSVIGAGDLFGLISDTPQARELMRYLVSAEAQEIWVGRGGALSGNMRVTAYPDRISRRAAQLLADAKHFRFDASDSMPREVSDAFLAAVLEFTRDQTRLPEILRHLDAVQQAVGGR